MSAQPSPCRRATWYAFGTLETVTSLATAAIQNINDAPLGTVSIAGTAIEDATLFADVSTLSDADGLGALTYEWQRDGVAISGATGATYTLGDTDVGRAVSLKVSYVDLHGTVEQLTSLATATVANVNDLPVGVPVIAGASVEGSTLSVDVSAIADADGLGALRYQWLRGGVAIPGATATAYTLTGDDVRAAISVRVSFTDAHGTAEHILSAALGAISALPRIVVQTVEAPTVVEATADPKAKPTR